MSVRPIVLGGMMQNQQNISNVKQNEDQRPVLHQQQALHTVNKHEEAVARQVLHKDDPQAQEYRFDARDGGKNKYYGKQQKKKDKQKEHLDDGEVRVKGMSTGFDITI